MSRREPRPTARSTRTWITRRLAHRRSLSWLLIACLVAGAVAAFGQDLVRDLVAGAVTEPGAPVRSLSTAEAERLAIMRQRNWQDGRAAVRATIRHGSERAQVAGWVDWRRPSAYLAVAGARPDAPITLVQAVPGMVATRAGNERSAATGGPSAGATGPRPDAGLPLPPVEPPGGGWRIHAPGGQGPPGAATAPGTIDTLITLLFGLRAERPDAASLLARSEARWLRRDQAGGHQVDVLLGPAVPPTAADPRAVTPVPDLPTDLADMGGAVQYWLDEQARLHRLEALLAADTPVRVDLDRSDQTIPAVLDQLGGDAIDPRPLAASEVDKLHQLPHRNQLAGGGEVRLTVPGAGGTVTATGWLDWQRTVAYLALSRDGADSGLLWADAAGVARRPDPPAEDGMPPQPLPAGAGWTRATWEEQGDEHGGFDLELLVNEALALGGGTYIDADLLRVRARWLRSDQVDDGTAVDVYELPRGFEHAADLAPGNARMRYWVDSEGVLRRLEIRTRTGAFGQLDLTPGPVPYLG